MVVSLQSEFNAMMNEYSAKSAHKSLKHDIEKK